MATKNHHSGTEDRGDPPIAGRITDGNQVFAVEFLLQHIHPDHKGKEEGDQIQKVKKKVTKSDAWFANARIGENTHDAAYFKGA